MTGRDLSLQGGKLATCHCFIDYMIYAFTVTTGRELSLLIKGQVFPNAQRTLVPDQNFSAKNQHFTSNI